MNQRAIIDADETDIDLDALGINHKEPSQDDIHLLLWGVLRGQPIPFEEFDTATVGEEKNG
jgi:hypothetical protein